LECKEHGWVLRCRPAAQPIKAARIASHFAEPKNQAAIESVQRKHLAALPAGAHSGGKAVLGEQAREQSWKERIHVGVADRSEGNRYWFDGTDDHRPQRQKNDCTQKETHGAALSAAQPHHHQ
jgi:hypothetical protein